MNFQLTAGVLTEIGFGLLTNAKIMDNGIDDTILVPKTEILALDILGNGELTESPSGRKPIFCFIYKNGIIQEKIAHSGLSEKILSFGADHIGDNVLVEYYYEYGGQATLYIIDKNRFQGLFSLEAKMEIKGDTDGLSQTMLVSIPKMRMMSNLNLRLGQTANPVVSVFNIMALSQKTPYSESSVIEFIQLYDDIIN